MLTPQALVAARRVVFAKDMDTKPPSKVALKIMENQDEYEREINMRKTSHIDPQHVVAITQSHDTEKCRFAHHALPPPALPPAAAARRRSP